MFGILDIIVLLLVRWQHCSRCGKSFWAPPAHAGRELAIGREVYLCGCGNRFTTGRQEWHNITSEEKRRYLWSGLATIPLVITPLAAIGGYLLR
jgi:hypothetical protein